MSIVPRKRPCASCPYRCDVPSGLWDESEYAKLPEYDKETAYQPPGAFFCHQQDGRLCAGWVATHDMQESLGFRFYVQLHSREVSEEEITAVLDYATDVPLFSSGAEAAGHGRREIDRPGPAAHRTIERLTRRKEADELRG